MDKSVNNLKVVGKKRKPKYIYKSTMSLGLINTDEKPLRVDVKQLERVRKSRFVDPILKAMASDVCSLKFSLEGDESQIELFKDFIDNKFTVTILEMLCWGWIYGNSFAQSFSTLETINGETFWKPKSFVPFNMSKVKIDYDKKILTINRKEIPFHKCLNLTVFTEAGLPYPNGVDYYDLIVELELAKKTWVHATCSNAVGIQTQELGPNASLTEDEQNDLLKWNEAYAKNVGMAMTMPRDVKNVIQASPGVSTDFEKMIGYLFFLFLSGLRSQWAMASITSPGTYGTTVSNKVSYDKYVNYLADIVEESLNNMLITVCEVWNNIPCAVKVVHEKMSSNVDYAIIDAITKVVGINAMLTEPQKEHLYNILGLPYESIEITEKPVTMSTNYHTDILKSKKTLVFEQFQKYINNVLNGGVRQYFKFTGNERLCDDLHITDESKRHDVKKYFDSIQDGLNTILIKTQSNPQLNWQVEFNNEWAKLENEVKKWTKTN